MKKYYVCSTPRKEAMAVIDSDCERTFQRLLVYYMVKKFT